jgi:hypothetical protein
MSHFIILVLRTVSNPDPYYPLFLTPEQIDAAKALDAALDDPSVQLIGPIHALAYALISNSRPEVAENQFRCPQIVFLIFSNLHSDSVFETPETISRCLPKFSWVIRATGVYEAWKERENYPDGMLGYALF